LDSFALLIASGEPSLHAWKPASATHAAAIILNFFMVIYFVVTDTLQIACLAVNCTDE